MHSHNPSYSEVSTTEDDDNQNRRINTRTSGFSSKSVMIILLLWIIFLSVLFTFTQTFKMSDNTLPASTQKSSRNQDDDEQDLVDHPASEETSTELNDLPPFNKKNPHFNFCPYAECNNSPMCQPCARRFVIILAEGRSGSTTLIDMLDRLPNIRMAGENNGELIKQLDAVNTLQMKGTTFEYDKPRGNAWRHNPIPKQSFACPVQHYFEVMNPPSKYRMKTQHNDDDTIIGFKTIRYHQDGIWGKHYDPDKLCKFLIEHFPCSKVIVNYRSDEEALQKSIVNTFKMKSKTLESIEKSAKRLLSIGKCLGEERAKIIDMTEWSKVDEITGESLGLHIFDEVATFLGYKGCKFPFLLHENSQSGEKPGYGRDGNEEHLKFPDWCKSP